MVVFDNHLPDFLVFLDLNRLDFQCDSNRVVLIFGIPSPVESIAALLILEKQRKWASSVLKLIRVVTVNAVGMQMCSELFSFLIV